MAKRMNNDTKAKPSIKEKPNKPKQPKKKIKVLNQLGEFKLWVKGARLVSNGVCDLLESNELMALVGRGMEFIGKGVNEYESFNEALKKDESCSVEKEVKTCPNCGKILKEGRYHRKHYDTGLKYCSTKCYNEATDSDEEEDEYETE